MYLPTSRPPPRSCGTSPPTPYPPYPPYPHLQASPEKLWNLSRHVVASVYTLYFQLAGGASDGGKQVTESEWQVLLQTGLISQEEKKKLAEYRGFKPFLLQVTDNLA